jgi:hypothetical protein
MGWEFNGLPVMEQGKLAAIDSLRTNLVPVPYRRAASRALPRSGGRWPVIFHFSFHDTTGRLTPPARQDYRDQVWSRLLVPFHCWRSNCFVSPRELS